jgi:hypothetical protein
MRNTLRETAMIELVLVYCLSADTTSCIEKRLPMEDFPTPAACTMGAQLRAQEYLADHPKYMLKGWRCEVNVPRQDPA